jgi:hypothetical protein
MFQLSRQQPITIQENFKQLYFLIVTDIKIEFAINDYVPFSNFSKNQNASSYRYITKTQNMAGIIQDPILNQYNLK